MGDNFVLTCCVQLLVTYPSLPVCYLASTLKQGYVKMVSHSNVANCLKCGYPFYVSRDFLYFFLLSYINNHQ